MADTQPDSPSLANLILLGAGFIGYLLPWIVASSAAMTLHAYDLAEWASLHPSQLGTSPPLLAPLLLRSQLVILSLLVGLLATGKRHILAAAPIILLLALAQLPPYEFVHDLNNLNYRQQLVLAVTSLLLASAALRLGPGRLQLALMMSLSLGGMVAIAGGVRQAQALYAQLNQAADVGAGAWILGLSYLAIAGMALEQLAHRRRG